MAEALPPADSSRFVPVVGLPEAYQRLQREVADVCAQGVRPHAAEADATARFPRPAYDALVAAALHAPHLPPTYGGRGADALATCVVIEEVARACAATSLVPAVNKLGTLPLLMAGSEEQRRRYLPEVAAGRAMFSYALSEREAGSDTASMRTRARPDGRGGWVLDGQKSWITNAGESSYYTVMAVTDPQAGPRGVSAFVVHADDEGFTVLPPEHKLGIRGSPTCELAFEGCRLPPDRLVGPPGQGLRIALRTLDHTRVTIGAQAVGVAQAALDEATAWLRQEGGSTMGDAQGRHFLLADLAMRVEAARHLVHVAAARSERDAPDLPYAGAAAKCFASDTAMAVTVDAADLVGEAALRSGSVLERLVRDAKITQIYEGTNQVQRLVVARSLLRGDDR